MGPDVDDLFNGARQWEQTKADYAMSMMVLSSTMYHKLAAMITMFNSPWGIRTKSNYPQTV